VKNKENFGWLCQERERERETEKEKKKIVDDWDNLNRKHIRKPLGTSWSYGGSGSSGLKVITTEETEQQEGRWRQSQTSLTGSPPTVAPTRSCHRKIKQWKSSCATGPSPCQSIGSSLPTCWTRPAVGPPPLYSTNTHTLNISTGKT
jgi:hypothetical protein